MTTKILDMIAQVRDDDDCPKDLLRLLEETQEELTDASTDEEAEDLFQKKIIESLHLMDETDLTEEDQKYMEDTSGVVRNYLEEKDLKFSESAIREDVTVFELGFQLKDFVLRMKMYVEANPRVVRIDGIFPISADSAYEYVFCKKIVAFNYPKRFGALQYDERDGEVSYRYSFPVRYGLHEDVLEDIFHAVILSSMECYEDIRRACVGKLKSKEKAEILENIDRLISDIRDED